MPIIVRAARAGCPEPSLELHADAGIGEHSAAMRSRICRRLGVLGVELDETLNHATSTDERRISRGPIDV